MQMVVDLLNNFAVPVVCLIALGWYANNITNKLISLTEKVTTAMVENSENMSELSKTIDKMISFIEKG